MNSSVSRKVVYSTRSSHLSVGGTGASKGQKSGGDKLWLFLSYCCTLLIHCMHLFLAGGPPYDMYT